MNLVQIGTLTLNFGLVSAVRDLSTPTSRGLCILFSNGLKIDLVNPPDVDALNGWLLQNATQLPPVGP